MNILQISPQVPYPPTDGGKRGIYNILKPLAERGHRIILAALSRDALRDVGALGEICDVRIIPYEPRGAIRHQVMSLFSSVPFTVAKYHSAEAMRQILTIAKTEKIDVVHVDSLHCGTYGVSLKQHLGIPVALRMHDYLTAMMDRFHSYQKDLPLRIFSGIQVRKLMRYEGPLCLNFDRCIMVSAADERKLKQAAPGSRTVVIPPSVDTAEFAPSGGAPEPFSILWYGALHWEPNRDSLSWFLEKIFPSVLEKCPEAKLYVAGSGNSGHALRVPDRVEVLGFVEDIRVPISRCSLAVIPLRIGSGVRVKLLELFSMGKPVVSTTLGAEGTEAVHGRHLLLADDAGEFSNAVVRLLGDAHIQKTLSSNARSYVIERFDCRVTALQFETEYRALIEEHRSGAAGLKDPTPP